MRKKSETALVVGERDLKLVSIAQLIEELKARSEGYVVGVRYRLNGDTSQWLIESGGCLPSCLGMVQMLEKQTLAALESNVPERNEEEPNA